MRTEGLIKSWNDERGFGFIEPVQGGQDIFVHVKALRPRMKRPVIGQLVSFEIEQGREGKKRAANVEPVRASRFATRPRTAGRPGNISLLVIPAFVVVYALVAILWRVSHWVAVGYVVLSIVCFVLYLIDKSAAKSGAWRTSENALLLVGLLGGWPGGLLARHLLRHKSVKVSFRNAFWQCVAINVCAFVILSSPLLKRLGVPTV